MHPARYCRALSDFPDHHPGACRRSGLLLVLFPPTSPQDAADTTCDASIQVKHGAGHTHQEQNHQRRHPFRCQIFNHDRPPSVNRVCLLPDRTYRCREMRRRCVKTGQQRTAVTGQPKAKSRSTYISTLSGRIINNRGAMRAGRPRSQGKQSVVSSQPKAAKGATREARGPLRHPASGLPATFTTPGQSDSRTP